MTSRRLFIAALAVLCLLAAPATSSAASRSFEMRFELNAGHGYRLAVIGHGDTVMVEVGSPRSLDGGSLPESRLPSQSLTAYAARGTVTPRRIAVSFGKFGRIDVSFHPSGKAVALPAKDHCRGVDHFTRQRGVFVGAIRFEGEHRYVAVHAHRAPGRVRSPLRLQCFRGRFRAAASERGREVTPVDPDHSHRSLLAFWRHAVTAAELYAEVDHGRVFTSAYVEESLGRVAEYHFAQAVSRPRVLAIDNALTRATLAPPVPFRGKGTYEAAPDGSKSWTGPLSVSFPGTPRWPLTGEQFKVSLGGGL